MDILQFNNLFEEYKIPTITNGVKIPEFIIPSEELQRRGLDRNISSYAFLEYLCYEGLKIKIGNNNPRNSEYVSRLKKELSLFKELDFAGYALMTWDIIRFCRQNNISTGFARGSAAGSLVLFLIDVVNNVDPVIHNLYFERFLSKARAKFKEIDGHKYYDGSLLFDVDLDIDFCRRQEVIDYLEKKYQGQTAKLLTVSTLSSKVLIKEIIKTYLGLKEEFANEISDTIPKEYGRVFTIDESIAASKEFAKFASDHPKAIEIARKLHGLYLHYGVHPSAVVISAHNIESTIPLQLTKDKERVTGYAMDETLNLACKIDILGLRSATLINNVCRMVGISPNSINLHDPIIYENFRNLECPHGIFQIEAECNFNVLKKIKPRNLNDLSAIMAIARPGALKFVDDYAKYVETGNAQSIHPFFDDVFMDSGGVCLYQESLMRAANKIGFSLDEAEQLRRVIGKKKREEMPVWEKRVYELCNKNNLPKEVGKILWDIMDASKDYSFNKSHSVSYASMSAATAYLKFKYPKEFFTCLLELSSFEPNPIEQVSKIYKELPYFGIKLLAPHILLSDNNFKIEGDNIRMGLSSVKSISEQSISKLQKFKSQYSNKFEIFMAAKSAGLNLAVISALILTGSLDDMLTESRAKTQLEYVLWNTLTDNEKNWAIKLGALHNYDLMKIVKLLNTDIKATTGKPIIKDSRRQTIRKKIDPHITLYNYNKRNQRLCNWYFENLLLGFSYSTTLYDIYRDKLENLTPLNQAMTELQNTEVTTIGKVIKATVSQSRVKKTPYLRLQITDSNAEAKIMMFNMSHHNYIEEYLINNKRMPEENDIVIVTGEKKDGDCIFAKVIGLQDIKMFGKISQLPKENELTSDT